MSENLPEDLVYTEEHEWVRRGADGICRVGITAFAQDELGEVVFVDFPEVGESFAAGDEVGSIESVKAVAEVYTPLGGEVVAVNGSLEDEPEKVNSDPYGEGWLFELRCESEAELDKLLSAQQYEDFVAGL